MKLTLLHKTTQQKAIQIIEKKAEELMQLQFSQIIITNKRKEWDNNILRFSFTVGKMFLNLDFQGIIIVTDSDVIGEAEVPSIVTSFFSEERIKEVITNEFNKLFNIQ